MLVRDGAPVFRAERGVHDGAARPEASALGRRADRRRAHAARGGRRPAGRLLGRDDELRARAGDGDGSARCGAMALDGGGSTTLAFDGSVLQPPVRRTRAADLELRSCSRTRASTRRRRPRRCSPRTATALPRSRRSATRSCARRRVTVTLTGPTERRRLPGVRRPGARHVRRAVPAASASSCAASGAPTPCRGSAPAASSPASAASAPDGAATARRGPLDASRRRHGRPGPRLVDRASVLGQLDARVPPGAAASAPRPSARPERDDRMDADAAGARHGDGRDVERDHRCARSRERRFEPGPQSVVWNGLTQRGRARARRPYRVRVTARNEVGAVELERPAPRTSRRRAEEVAPEPRPALSRLPRCPPPPCSWPPC